MPVACREKDCNSVATSFFDMDFKTKIDMETCFMLLEIPRKKIKNSFQRDKVQLEKYRSTNIITDCLRFLVPENNFVF